VSEAVCCERSDACTSERSARYFSLACACDRLTSITTMDPQTDLPDLVEDLEVNIDELTAALDPLLAAPLHTTASSLPLLDKAEFYCMSAYAIEAILFSVLKASGVNATQHHVFKEIARLKQYNSKIKHIKDRGVMGSAEGRARLDLGAAQRFIKHGLAGNDRYDLERQERMAKEKARAHLKAQNINKKFDSDGNALESTDATSSKRAVDELNAQEDYSDSHVLQGSDEAEPAPKKARVDAAAESQQEPAPDTGTPQPKKRRRPAKRDNKTTKTRQDLDTVSLATPSRAEERVTRTRNKRLSTQNSQEDEPVVPTPDRAPKTRSETFSALLDGSLNQNKKKGIGGKGNRKGGKGKAK